MSELDFQRALARFLTDPVTRQAVLADGESPPPTGADGSPVDVSPPVRDRLRALDRGRTSMFSQLLVMNRLTKIMEALPCTSWAIGAKLWEVAQVYNLRCPPNDPKKVGEARMFVRFIQDAPDVVQVGPAWLLDVVRYESTVLELRFSPQEPPAGQVPRDDGVPIALLQPERLRPRLHDTARVCTFGYDIEEILSSFAAGRVPPVLPAHPMTVLLQVLPDGTVRQDEISPAIERFLAACTGRPTLTDVITRLADDLGGLSPNEIVAGCLGLCEELAARGVLQLDEAGSRY